MLRRRVVDDQIDDDPDAPVARFVQQFGEIAQRAQTLVDRVEIGDVIAVVAVRRRVDRIEPQTGDAQSVQVVEATDQATEIAISITIGIRERVHVNAVHHGLVVPAFAHTARSTQCRRPPIGSHSVSPSKCRIAWL